MRHRLLLLLVGLVCGLPTTRAHAHFLFVRIGPHAEAGRSVHVFFSEQATAGDPAFVDKITQTQLWAQSAPGEFHELKIRKAHDRLAAYLPMSGALAVVGRCEYGVLERKTPFLLQYYPKAITGEPEKLNALKPNRELPLEIVAQLDDEKITLTALHNGKPVANAKFTTIDDDLNNEEITANEAGEATWSPTEPGYYCVYTNVTIREAGELNGKKYTETRMFATLAFQWPLVRTDVDEEAVDLFQQAIDARASWRDFPGFKANVTGTANGVDFNGSVTVDAEGGVQIEIDNEAASDWVEDQLGSLAMHRMSSPDRGKPVMRFADDDADHPLGRLLTFSGGSMASSYRVKNQQIIVVNRNMGSLNMTITVLDNIENRDGNYLPRSYTVQYWDAKSGRLLKTETIQNAWTRIDRWDLPTRLTVAESTSDGFAVRNLKLTDHQLVKQK